MNETGVLTRISYIIIRKLGGSFSGAVWAVFASTLIVSVVTFGMGWIVAVPVVLGVIKALKLEKGREAGLICFAGITGAIDCAVILYSPSTCGILDSIIQEFLPGYTMNIFTSLIYCWPVIFFCIAVIAIILWKYKRDLKKHPEQTSAAPVTKQYFTEQLTAMGPMSADEKKTMAVFCIILIMYILSAFLGWSSTYYFMLLPYLTFLPVVGCKDKAMTALKNLNFNGVFFASSCVGIGFCRHGCRLQHMAQQRRYTHGQRKWPAAHLRARASHYSTRTFCDDSDRYVHGARLHILQDSCYGWYESGLRYDTHALCR